MKYVMYGFLSYSVFNFVAVFAGAQSKAGSSGPMTPAVVRGFFGHRMVFYSAPAALLYFVGNAARPVDDGSLFRRL
jgi:hypothetical protein